VTKDASRRSCPTDRQYWLIVAEDPETGEIKHFVSNASEKTPLEEMSRVAFARWHVEKWFERAKQECEFGSFEVRDYQSLIRHWLCSRIGMYILAAETTQLQGKNPMVTFEQVARALSHILQRSLECDPALARLLAGINTFCTMSCI